MNLPLLVFLAAAQVTPELKQAVEAGLKAKQSGDLKTAAVEFRKVVQMAPTLAAAHVNLGAVLFEQQDYLNAIPSLQKALELNPQLPGAELMLGTAQLSLGYAADAIPHLERTQSMDLLGIALVETGRDREAVDRLEAALANRASDPDLLYYLGRAHMRLAKQSFDQVAPDSARGHQLRAETNAAAGRREIAAKDYAAALSKRSYLRGVHLAMGDLALESGDVETALKEFAEEFRLTPGSALAAFRYGRTLLIKGDSAEGLKVLRRADELRPEMPETLVELGKAEAAAGDPARAEKAWKKVVELEPESALAEAAHFQLGLLYRRLKRTVDAERETQKFRELKARRQQ
jgi:tetratricopeptide (TPR) repeat protein